MNHKNILFKIISAPFILLGVIGGMDTIINMLNPKVTFPWESLIITLLIVGLLLIAGSIFIYLSFSKQKQKEKFSAVFVKAVFIFYGIVALVVLFGSGTFQRYGEYGSSTENIWQTANLIPMKTIGGYLVELINHGAVNVALGNLLGNMIIFAPMGFFLPYFQKQANTWYIFIGEMLILLVSVEIMQLVTTRGICDIDDVILNLVGAYIIWLLCRTRIIKKILHYFCIEI